MNVRRFLLLAVAAATGLAVSVPHVSTAAADDQIPIKGQAFSLGIAASGPPAVVTVHGVRRVDQATIVYWSLGLPEGADGGNGLRYLGPATTSFYAGDVGPTQGDVALTDGASARVFRPLQPGNRSSPCVCSPLDAVFKLEPGQASVVWSAVVPLPPEVRMVDVSVAEQVIPDVPVEDGLLEPLANTDQAPHILGLGWPKVDEELLAAAKTPTPAFYSLTSRVSDLEQTVTTSKGEVALAADVLFAKDSAALAPKGQATIAKAAAEIKASGGGKALTVTGHADSDAADAYNLTLSKKRADAVAAALTKALGDGYTITSVGKGETQPIADNKTDEGKAKNRRVTITFEGGK